VLRTVQKFLTGVAARLATPPAVCRSRVTANVSEPTVVRHARQPHSGAAALKKSTASTVLRVPASAAAAGEAADTPAPSALASLTYAARPSTGPSLRVRECRLLGDASEA
jgi:hypothetical protein